MQSKKTDKKLWMVFASAGLFTVFVFRAFSELAFAQDLPGVPLNDPSVSAARYLVYDIVTNGHRLCRDTGEKLKSALENEDCNLEVIVARNDNEMAVFHADRENNTLTAIGLAAKGASCDVSLPLNNVQNVFASTLCRGENVKTDKTQIGTFTLGEDPSTRTSALSPALGLQAKTSVRALVPNLEPFPTKIVINRRIEGSFLFVPSTTVFSYKLKRIAN